MSLSIVVSVGDFWELIRWAYRFHAFFASLDGVRRPDLLYLSSKGISAAKEEVPGSWKAGRKPEEAAAAAAAEESEEDSDGPGQQDG